MINICTCMGPMYGEPYCPCGMSSRGLDKQMEENPLRIADNKQFEEGVKRWLASLDRLET